MITVPSKRTVLRRNGGGGGGEASYTFGPDEQCYPKRSSFYRCSLILSSFHVAAAQCTAVYVSFGAGGRGRGVIWLRIDSSSSSVAIKASAMHTTQRQRRRKIDLCLGVCVCVYGFYYISLVSYFCRFWSQRFWGLLK